MALFFMPLLKVQLNIEMLNKQMGADIMNIEKLGKKLSIDTKNAILLNSSIILLLSKHESYKDEYKDHKEDAAQFLHKSINEYLPENIISYFNFIDNIKSNEDLYDIIGKIEKEDIPYDKDLVSDFSKDEKKSLGIVLTPEHIADLMARIINVSENDILLDTCSGTGRLAMTQKETKDLICIEQQPYMHALLTMNALMNDIDTDNIILGSCFDYESEEGRKPTKCIINPPYGLGKGLTELDFMLNALNNMEVGGKLAAIVPTSTAIDCKKSKLALRKELLENHTLEAVMSMPDELFYPVGVNTCIIVFTAGVPHSGDTYFASWKEDGYEKTKNNGRVDKDNKWPELRDNYLDEYNNKEIVPQKSCIAHVSANDEWILEAYAETDYSQLTKKDFERAVFNYAIFKLMESNR